MEVPEHILRNQREAALWYCLFHKDKDNLQTQDHEPSSPDKTEQNDNRIAVIVDFIDSVKTQSNAANKKEAGREYAKIWLEALTLVAVIAYATIAALQWCELRTNNALIKQDFHVTQQAYVTVINPILKTDAFPPTIIFLMSNTGKQVSGPVDTTIYEATTERGFGAIGPFDMSDIAAAAIQLANEIHCEKHHFGPLIPTVPITIFVNLPHLEVGKEYDIGREDSGKVVVTAGRVHFNNGFAEDTALETAFCMLTRYKVKAIAPWGWAQCDPAIVLPEMEKKNANPACDKRTGPEIQTDF